MKLTDPPRRRWFRFSLREVFLAITAIACLAGWAREHVHEPDPDAMTIEQAMDHLNSKGVPEEPVGYQEVNDVRYQYFLRRQKIEP